MPASLPASSNAEPTASSYCRLCHSLAVPPAHDYVHELTREKPIASQACRRYWSDSLLVLRGEEDATLTDATDVHDLLQLPMYMVFSKMHGGAQIAAHLADGPSSSMAFEPGPRAFRITFVIPYGP